MIFLAVKLFVIIHDFISFKASHTKAFFQATYQLLKKYGRLNETSEDSITSRPAA